MRRVVTGLLLAALCLAVPCAVRAQATEDSLASPWSLARPRPSRPTPDGQEGRTALTSVGVLLGMGLYGWTIPALTPHQSPQQGFEMYAAGAFASALLPWAASKRWPVSRGVATMAANGAVRGALHGALLYSAAGGDDRGFWSNRGIEADAGFFDIGDPGDGTRERRMLRYMVATSLGEATLGYAWAHRFHLTDGDAAAIATFGDFGMIDGDAGAQWSMAPVLPYQRYYWDFHRGVYVPVPSPPENAHRRVAVAALAGCAAGQATGALLASRRHYSYGGASLMRTTGMLGMWAGFCAAHGPTDNPAARRRRVVGVIAGGTAGLALGDHLSAGREVTAGRAARVEAATLIGGLAGLALAYVPGPDPSAASALSCHLAGAVTGFTLSYRALIRHAPAAQHEEGAWRLDLEPQGLLALAHVGPASGSGTAAPLVTLRCRLP